MHAGRPGELAEGRAAGPLHLFALGADGPLLRRVEALHAHRAAPAQLALADAREFAFGQALEGRRRRRRVRGGRGRGAGLRLAARLGLRFQAAALGLRLGLPPRLRLGLGARLGLRREDARALGRGELLHGDGLGARGRLVALRPEPRGRRRRGAHVLAQPGVVLAGAPGQGLLELEERPLGLLRVGLAGRVLPRLPLELRAGGLVAQELLADLGDRQRVAGRVARAPHGVARQRLVLRDDAREDRPVALGDGLS